jgi:hypothetical protein
MQGISAALLNDHAVKRHGQFLLIPGPQIHQFQLSLVFRFPVLVQVQQQVHIAVPSFVHGVIIEVKVHIQEAVLLTLV